MTYLLDRFDVGAVTRIVATTADQAARTYCEAHHQQRSSKFRHF